MPSIRRTTRLTTQSKAAQPIAPRKETVANKRGYVAVNLCLAPQTNEMLCTANKDMTIEGVNGASVSLKAGEKFYVVRAASLGDNMFYIVRLIRGEKKCSCAANKPCKHEVRIATLEVAKGVEKPNEKPKKKSNHSLIFSGAAAASQTDATKNSDAAVLEVSGSAKNQSELGKIVDLTEVKKVKKTMEDADLHGSRAFSLLR